MTISKRIEIPMFPGGKRLAFTTSWDDGTIHDRQMVALLNSFGIKGTYNLNSGIFGPSSGWHHRIEASEVASLFAGNEVAVHTVTHPWLQLLDPSQIAYEVLDDRKALEDLVGYPVRGMAYPFGTSNARVVEVLRALGIVYCRSTQSGETTWPPAEPLVWGTTAHFLAPDLPERFKAWYENPRSKGLYYVWGHSYECEERKDWDAVTRVFKPMSGKNDIWYCTNIELFDYEAARNRLVIAANRGSAHNPSGTPVTVSCDGKLVEIPGGKTIRLA